MNLTAIGIGDRALESRIHAAATPFDLHVNLDDDLSAESALAGDERDWDILLIGPVHADADLIGLIRDGVQEHPTGFVLIIPPSGADADFQRRCLGAGALDILPAEASRDQLEMAIGRAVTLISRYEARLHDEKLQAISQLAVGVNHEINNPLMGLMGTAELIMIENQELPEKVKKDLKTVLEQARRIQSITMRLRHLDHLRTVPYDDRASMIDLVGRTDQPAEPAVPVEPSVFTSPRVLMVDDNELILDLSRRILGERFEIDAETRPSLALNRVREREYDLVVLDLIMPEMDGLELFRAIRRSRPDQKIIIATAYGSDRRVRELMSEGALDWVQKPFKFEKLERIMWAALNRTQSSRTTVTS